jgi:hypothetical protein
MSKHSKHRPSITRIIAAAAKVGMAVKFDLDIETGNITSVTTMTLNHSESIEANGGSILETAEKLKDLI